MRKFLAARVNFARCLGVDVAGQGNAGSPGSDGASPYLSLAFTCASPLPAPVVRGLSGSVMLFQFLFCFSDVPAILGIDGLELFNL